MIKLLLIFIFYAITDRLREVVAFWFTHTKLEDTEFANNHQKFTNWLLSEDEYELYFENKILNMLIYPFRDLYHTLKTAQILLGMYCIWTLIQSWSILFFPIFWWAAQALTFWLVIKKKYWTDEVWKFWKV